MGALVLTFLSLQTDFEISQGKVDSLIKKPKRSDRENVSLAKAEAELANAKEVRSSALNLCQIPQSNNHVSDISICRR